MTTSPTDRTIAAEVRFVEEGHNVRLARTGDCLNFLVKSDSWPGVTYKVRILASVRDLVMFLCDHTEFDQKTGTRLVGGRSALTYVPCKHAAGGARRLEREGLIKWENGRWTITEKAAVPTVDVDPFAGLPGIELGREVMTDGGETT